MRTFNPEDVELQGRPRLGEVLSHEDERLPIQATDAGGESDQEVEDDEATPLNVALTCLASGLSVAGSGFAAGGLFAGTLARAVGVLGAAVGAGMVWLSYRTRRTAAVQMAAIPLAVLTGTLLMLPYATGGSANLPSLIAEALRDGGIAQPPVAFDPGWRFLLVVLIVLMAAAAAALAIGLGRPKLGVFLPIPVVFGALAAQSNQESALPIVGALALLAASLAVSFGVELAREGATSGRFELRRLMKGAGVLVVLVALLAGLTRVSFLFPEPNRRVVIPPRRPPPAPPEPDRELFVVRSDRQLPWRMGVLDVYDGRGWLTPPFDTSRLDRIPGDGSLPQPRRTDGEKRPATVRVTFTISDVRGHVIPGIANPTRVAVNLEADYDPRTQILRLPTKRPAKGMIYAVEAHVPPSGQDLMASEAPPPSLDEFLSAPEPPTAVVDLLAQAPRDNLFTRLQFVREKFYAAVVAKGAGQPVDVPPARVAELLDGEPGTPFEITAAETLLARWAGVASRVGYGYFGGDPAEGSAISVRPRHAATWLEAYFEGYGWVPIVGTPPRAQASLATAQTDRAVRPSENLTLSAYVPVRLQSLQLLYSIVRFWAERVIPLVALGALILWLYPGALKAVRRRRRRRWAQEGGIADRIRVAYAEFRDVAFDYNVGYPSLTPLEFLSRIQADREHTELAWLVTRCLWGDLARDLRREDAELTEEMARSLIGRLRMAHPATTRLMAFASRRSLRGPFTDEIPNPWWPQVPLRLRLRRRLARALREPVRLLRRMGTATGFILLVVLLSGCVQTVDLTSRVSADLPERLVPETLGEVSFRRETSTERAYAEDGAESLVGTVRVFSIHHEDRIVGALHVAAFKASLADREREARAGVLQAFDGRRFELRRIGRERIYVQRQPELQQLLWFPEKGFYYELLVARSDFEQSGEIFAQILAFQRGERADELIAPPPDPRRGFDG